jgi:hypothetical protein
MKRRIRQLAMVIVLYAGSSYVSAGLLEFPYDCANGEQRCAECCDIWAECCENSGGTPNKSSCSFQDPGGGSGICYGPSCDGGTSECPPGGD